MDNLRNNLITDKLGKAFHFISFSELLTLKVKNAPQCGEKERSEKVSAHKPG